MASPRIRTELHKKIHEAPDSELFAFVESLFLFLHLRSILKLGWITTQGREPDRYDAANGNHDRPVHEAHYQEDEQEGRLPAVLLRRQLQSTASQAAAKG